MRIAIAGGTGLLGGHVARELLIPVPLPGQLGRALRAGALTAERPDVLGTVRFADWLRAQRDQAPRREPRSREAQPPGPARR
jgi:uncharacterized protein YbjT (DUF2867 family)